MCISGAVVGNTLGIHWDLGSIPRSPNFLVSIFSRIITCRLSNSFHHRPHIPAFQVSISANPRARDGWPPCSPVKACITNPESQQA